MGVVRPPAHVETATPLAALPLPSAVEEAPLRRFITFHAGCCRRLAKASPRHHGHGAKTAKSFVYLVFLGMLVRRISQSSQQYKPATRKHHYGSTRLSRYAATSDYEQPTSLSEYRVEKLPGNARRIYTSIDIRGSVDAVWGVLTNYASLQDVVPNLVQNDILEFRPADGGAMLWQVAQTSFTVPGTEIACSFTAGCTLEVHLHPEGVPESQMQAPMTSQADADQPTPFTRGVFPNPDAYKSAETKNETRSYREITMQNVQGAKGSFRHYQGVWRLTDISEAEGEKTVRLSFAVEVAPHWFMPLSPVEDRLAVSLEENLRAIRDFVESGQTRAGGDEVFHFDLRDLDLRELIRDQ